MGGQARREADHPPSQAYGIVWKAVDRRTGEVVAIKKILDAFRDKTDAQVIDGQEGRGQGRAHPCCRGAGSPGPVGLWHCSEGRSPQLRGCVASGPSGSLTTWAPAGPAPTHASVSSQRTFREVVLLQVRGQGHPPASPGAVSPDKGGSPSARPLRAAPGSPQAFGDHPNIIRLLDVMRAENDKDIYLVFESMGE